MFAYPETADRYYAIVAGRLEVPVIAQNVHAIAFDDGSDDDTTRITIIPRDPISSIASLDFSDALRWLGILELIRAVPKVLGWGPTEGFHIQIPVHPPYQKQPWLCVHLTRSWSKTVKPGADKRGYTRDIGHFVETVEMRKRVDVVYSNDNFMIFHNFEDEDNADYDTVLMGIPRHEVATILDPEFTDQDWLSLAASIRQAARRMGIDAYTTELNVGPPYQHTPWVHVHMFAGGEAIPPEERSEHKAAKHQPRARHADAARVPG